MTNKTTHKFQQWQEEVTARVQRRSINHSSLQYVHAGGPGGRTNSADK